MRVSSLPRLGACPGWWLLEQRSPRVPGTAADTGSAAGKAVALYHAGHPPREAAALALGREVVARDYPRADARRAGRLVAAYAADPRNAPGAAGDCEREVRLATVDLDGEPLVLVGHVDQVREGEVWDVKAGTALEGADLVRHHALQLAGYAAAGGWGVGGVVRLAGYEDGWDVFVPAGFGAADADRLLDVVRRDAADLRAGRVFVRPGPHCAWCPAGGPGTCLPRFAAAPPRREEVT